MVLLLDVKESLLKKHESSPSVDINMTYLVTLEFHKPMGLEECPFYNVQHHMHATTQPSDDYLCMAAEQPIILIRSYRSGSGQLLAL